MPLFANLASIDSLDLPDGDRQILLTAIRLCHNRFGESIDSIYLSGSAVDGTFISESDLDIIILAKDAPSKDLCTQIGRILSDHSERIGAILFRESDLREGIPEYAKASLPIAGAGKLNSAKSLPIEIAFQRWCLGSLKLMVLVRRNKTPLTLPLSLPTFTPLGYAIETENNPAPTKRLVNLAARIAGTLLILETNQQPSSKHLCIHKFATETSSPFRGWILDFYHKLKHCWHYQIPSEISERTQLETLLKRLLDFENHFLNAIAPHVHAARNEPSDTKQIWANDCLRLFSNKSSEPPSTEESPQGT